VFISLTNNNLVKLEFSSKLRSKWKGLSITQVEWPIANIGWNEDCKFFAVYLQFSNILKH